MTDTTLYNTIQANKRIAKKNETKRQASIMRDVRVNAIHEFATASFPEDHTARMIGAGFYKCNKAMQQTAAEAVKAVFSKLPADATAFEKEKALSEAAYLFDESLSGKSVPIGMDEEEAKLVDGQDAPWATPQELASAQRLNARDRQKNSDEWRNNNDKNMSKSKAFYVVAKFKVGENKVNFDSRKLLWVYNPKTKKRVKMPTMAIKTNSFLERASVINKVIEAYYKGQSLTEAIGASSPAMLQHQQRNLALKVIEKETGMKLEQSTAMIKSVHGKGEFPCLYFSWQKALEQPTRYKWAETRGLYKNVDDEVTKECGSYEPLDEPINGYRLESLVLQGRVDKAEEPLKGQNLDLKVAAEAGNTWHGIEINDMQPGHGAYVSYMLSQERNDLADNANITESPEYNIKNKDGKLEATGGRREAMVEMTDEVATELLETFEDMNKFEEDEFYPQALAMGKLIKIRSAWDVKDLAFSEEDAEEIFGLNWYVDARQKLGVEQEETSEIPF
jgi:hypothetical protein